MEYDLYHDESQEEGYWHGMLLVPCITRNQYLSYLKTIREETGYDSPIFLKKLKSKGNRFNCVCSWIQFGVVSLMQYFKNEPYKVVVFCGKEYISENYSTGGNYKTILEIGNNNKIIGAKFILFKERDSHFKMGENYPDHTAKEETTFRMGMVGGMHCLGTNENPIKIKSIHFDGWEHHKRKIDKERIINRIYGLRDYCSFDRNLFIDEGRANHNKEKCQNYDDCQFLQLTDLLVGGFRTILSIEKNKIQKDVAFPISQLVEKWRGGHSRMKNSRWFRGFWASECRLEDAGWKFNDFQIKNSKQKKLI